MDSSDTLSSSSKIRGGRTLSISVHTTGAMGFYYGVMYRCLYVKKTNLHVHIKNLCLFFFFTHMQMPSQFSAYTLLFVEATNNNFLLTSRKLS